MPPSLVYFLLIWSEGCEAVQVSFAGAKASLWRELMGLPREEEEALRRAGLTDLMSKVDYLLSYHKFAQPYSEIQLYLKQKKGLFLV